MLSEEEKKAIEKLSNGEKIELISLIRVFKKEEIENFVITRKEYIDTVLNLITKLQEENEEKDKAIDLIIEEFYKKMKISTNCYIQRKKGIEQCLNYKNCKECLKQYFEKLAKEKEGIKDE